MVFNVRSSEPVIVARKKAREIELVAVLGGAHRDVEAIPAPIRSQFLSVGKLRIRVMNRF